MKSFAQILFAMDIGRGKFPSRGFYTLDFVSRCIFHDEQIVEVELRGADEQIEEISLKLVGTFGRFGKDLIQRFAIVNKMGNGVLEFEH